MSPALEALEIGDQKFPTPDLPVDAKSSAIECDTDHLIAQVVLGHAACDMGMMMLHADLLKVRNVERELCTEIHRVQIVGHELRANSEQILHPLECFLEEH